MTARRLLVARLWFEGNRFAPIVTRLADFQRCEWARGDAALDAAKGGETELAAVVDFAAAHPGWQVSASRCASAWPAGPIDDALFDEFVVEVLGDVRRLEPDALYLSLHGAAITAHRDAPELDLVQRLREVLGARPLVASFDLHANLAPALTHWLDFATAYRTYPHVDLRTTAARTLARLDALCDGTRWHGHIAKLGALLPSFRMRSDVPPMATLLAEARALEARHDGCDISILGGFPYADTAHADAGVMAWAADPDQAQQLATQLLGGVRARQRDFDAALPSPAAAWSRALVLLQQQAAQRTPRIVALTDPADNPLSGGAADTPGLLRDLLARLDGLAPALHASSAVFAYFCDPALVQRAAAHGIGAQLSVQLGGRLSADFGAPVRTRARLLRITDGRFVNSGPMFAGQTVDAGMSIVLDIRGLSVIVTSAVVPANDPAFFALHGIELRDTRLLCVKAKNHFHAAFAPLCEAIIEVDCPGPATADLTQLPFRTWRPPSP